MRGRAEYHPNNQRVVFYLDDNQKIIFPVGQQEQDEKTLQNARHLMLNMANAVYDMFNYGVLHAQEQKRILTDIEDTLHYLMVVAYEGCPVVLYVKDVDSLTDKAKDAFVSHYGESFFRYEEADVCGALVDENTYKRITETWNYLPALAENDELSCEDISSTKIDLNGKSIFYIPIPTSRTEILMHLLLYWKSVLMLTTTSPEIDICSKSCVDSTDSLCVCSCAGEYHRIKEISSLSENMVVPQHVAGVTVKDIMSLYQTEGYVSSGLLTDSNTASDIKNKNIGSAYSIFRRHLT